MKHSMCWNVTKPKTYNISPALFILPSLPFATPCPKKTSQLRRPSTTTSSLRSQKKNPFRGHGRCWSRPPPQRRPPAAAGRRCRGRFVLRGAATWSLGAPAEVQRWKVQRCMVRRFSPIRNDAKVMEKILVGLATGKPALTLHSYQQTRNMGYHSQVHPCTGPVFGFKFDLTRSKGCEKQGP